MSTSSYLFLIRMSNIINIFKKIAGLLQHMSQMCINPEYSDVSFIVEGTKIPAHKNILATRSSYFRALLYGGLVESTKNEIELKVPLNVFKALLNYLYTGRMSLAKMNNEEILDCFSLTNEYGLEELNSAISIYLTNHLSLENCCAIFESARLFSLKTLTDASIKFIATNLNELLGSSSFHTLSQDSLCILLERDSFCAPELQIFNAVSEWYKKNPNADIEVSQTIVILGKNVNTILMQFQKIIRLVRLPLMSLDNLLDTVRSSKIVDLNVLLDAIKEKQTSDNLRYRGELSM